MIEISNKDLNFVCGGTNVFNLVEGALVGAAVEGAIGFIIAGPPGMIAGICKGLFDGASYAVIYEGSYGVYDIVTSQSGAAAIPMTFKITHVITT